MKVLMWNCRGAAKSPFSQYSHSLLCQFSLDICSFVETRLSEGASTRIQWMLGPRWDHYMVPAEGLSGGIVVACRRDIGQVNFTHTSRQVCFGVISPLSRPPWILGVVYASTNGAIRRVVWESASRVLSLGLPTVLIGDFNYLLHSQDKYGGKPFQVDRDVREFRAFVRTSGLIDIGFAGPRYTWCNNQQGFARVWEHLDRALVSDDWLAIYPESRIQHLSRFASDHCLILLSASASKERGGFSFRFEHFWKCCAGVHHIIKRAWRGATEFPPDVRLSMLLDKVRLELTRWNRRRMGNIFQKGKLFISKFLLCSMLNHSKGVSLTKPT